MARIAYFLALLSAFVALASAYSAPTFCKCTCFTNSTIIPLGPQHGSGSDSTPNPQARSLESLFGLAEFAKPSKRSLGRHQHLPPNAVARRSGSASCSQCNRAYCLNYNLPICKDAEEKDVVAMCFQRDSRKDQIIVWGFLLGTGSLLGWALAKHAVQLRAERAADSGRQAPLLGTRRGASSSGLFGFFRRLGGRGPAVDGGGLPATAAPRGQYAPLG